MSGLVCVVFVLGFLLGGVIDLIVSSMNMVEVFVLSLLMIWV